MSTKANLYQATINRNVQKQLNLAESKQRKIHALVKEILEHKKLAENMATQNMTKVEKARWIAARNAAKKRNKQNP